MLKGTRPRGGGGHAFDSGDSWLANFVSLVLDAIHVRRSYVETGCGRCFLVPWD